MIKTLTAIAIAGAAIASSMPIASAQPECTASGLSAALGQVASSTGAWLSAHPEAEAAVPISPTVPNKIRRPRPL